MKDLVLFGGMRLVGRWSGQMKLEEVGYAEISTRFRWRIGRVLEWR
jgi:hypothetical protein